MKKKKNSHLFRIEEPLWRAERFPSGTGLGVSRQGDEVDARDELHHGSLAPGQDLLRVTLRSVASRRQAHTFSACAAVGGKTSVFQRIKTHNKGGAYRTTGGVAVTTGEFPTRKGRVSNNSSGFCCGHTRFQYAQEHTNKKKQKCPRCMMASYDRYISFSKGDVLSSNSKRSQTKQTAQTNASCTNTGSRKNRVPLPNPTSREMPHSGTVVVPLNTGRYCRFPRLRLVETSGTDGISIQVVSCSEMCGLPATSAGDPGWIAPTLYRDPYHSIFFFSSRSHLHHLRQVVRVGLTLQADELVLPHGLGAGGAAHAEHGRHVRDGHLPELAVVNLYKKKQNTHTHR